MLMGSVTMRRVRRILKQEAILGISARNSVGGEILSILYRRFVL